MSIQQSDVEGAFLL